MVTFQLLLFLTIPRQFAAGIRTAILNDVIPMRSSIIGGSFAGKERAMHPTLSVFGNRKGLASQEQLSTMDNVRPFQAHAGVGTTMVILSCPIHEDVVYIVLAGLPIKELVNGIQKDLDPLRIRQVLQVFPSFSHNEPRDDVDTGDTVVPIETFACSIR